MSLRLGIVADEFFAKESGRMGGFGWAARQVAGVFTPPDLGVRVFFLAAHSFRRGRAGVDTLHDTPIIYRGAGPRYEHALRRSRLDLLLTVDYRPRYRRIIDALARVPVVVWIRDPRSPEAQARVATLSVPGDPSPPQGIAPIDCRSLGDLAAARKREGGAMLYCTPAPSLTGELPATYGIPSDDCVFLPNITAPGNPMAAKSPTPLAVFLGRLDPIKRPWLFVELARLFPAVEFVMLGQAHFTGPGSWRPDDLPPNVRLLGHVDGATKWRLLSSAWLLVNTSIHEALPTSVLEALSCATPILSVTDREGVASRFGSVVEWHGGDGMAGLEALAASFRRLVDDGPLRTRLGDEGRAWVAGTHDAATFLSAFDRLCARAGVRRAAMAVC